MIHWLGKLNASIVKTNLVLQYSWRCARRSCGCFGADSRSDCLLHHRGGGSQGRPLCIVLYRGGDCVCGGRPGMISAATGAMALLMVTLVKNHGLEYLLAATLLCGVLQIIAGYLQLGSLM